MGQKSWLEPTGLFGLLFVVVMLSASPLAALILYASLPCGTSLFSHGLLFELHFPFFSRSCSLLLSHLHSFLHNSHGRKPMGTPLCIQDIVHKFNVFCIRNLWLHRHSLDLCVLSFPRLITSASLLLVQLHTVSMHFLKRIWWYIKKVPMGRVLR